MRGSAQIATLNDKDPSNNVLRETFSRTIIFPEDAGIVDITKAPYFADPRDNSRDDTQAIRQALNDHAGEGKIIYLPSGTYNVTEPIVFPKGRSGWKWSGNRLQGQSTNSTIIKLKNEARGFRNHNKPLAIIRTTGHSEDWDVAQRFNNDISHITINSGQGNPGAIGLQFMSNNTGILESVKIISDDRQGKYGVDFGFSRENGPLFVKSLLIDGFNVGIFTASSLNSQTFENIVLKNQAQIAWKNQGQKVSVHNLIIDNSGAEGIYSNGGNFVLIGGRFFDNSDDFPAINLDGGYAYLRNVNSTGSQQVLKSVTPSGDVMGTSIKEYISHSVIKASSESAATSLNLPIEETPIVPWSPLERWANIKDFGATETSNNTEISDDELAIQKAIDSGAETIFFPNEARASYPRRAGDYEWDSVIVRGNVQRLIGTEAQRSFKIGTFVIDEEGPPVVIFERLRNIKIINHTTRTVIVKNASAHIEASGSGKTFLEDVVAGGTTAIKVSNGHQLYARQFNPEWNGNLKLQDIPIIDNSGGRIWGLGMKTESGGTIIRTRNNGKTEILGGHQYVIGTPEGGNNNMFIVENSSFAITSVETNFGGGKPYETYLKGIHKGTINEIKHTDIPFAGTGNAKAFPLLVAH